MSESLHCNIAVFFGNSNLGGQVLIWYWDGIRGTELRLGPLRTKGVEGDFKTEMEVWFHIRIKLVSTSKLKYHIKQDNDWSQTKRWIQFKRKSLCCLGSWRLLKYTLSGSAATKAF